MVGKVRIGGEIRTNGAVQRSKKLIDNEFAMTLEDFGQGVGGSLRFPADDLVYDRVLHSNGFANEPLVDLNNAYTIASPADRQAILNGDFSFTAGEAATLSQATDTPIYAPPVPSLLLAPGGLAIIHYSAEDADDPSIAGTQSMDRDSLSFVLLAPLAAGATIFFTDRAWNGTAFAAAGGGEGTFTFTAATNLAAGHVVTITTAQLNAAGINLNSGGLGGTPSAGETIFAYQGTINAPTNFIYALEIADGNNTFGATLAGTGLSVAANTATAIGADNASHAGRTWNIQIPDLLDSINDPNDWVTNENSPQSPDATGTNLFAAPDRQIWIAGSGGGDAIQIVNTDGTQSSNLLGYAISHLYQNTSVDGNPTTQRLWHPTDVVLDTVNDKFFIVDSDGTNDRILQGSISQALNNPGVAPTMTVLYFQAADEGTPGDTGDDGSIGLTGMAIDTANGAIYFTGNNLLQRVVYNTPNQTPVILANLGIDADTANPTFANEIGLDLARGFVYIVTTESFSDFLPPPAPNGTVGTVMYRNAIIRISNVAPGDTNATGNTVDRVLWSGVYDETNSAATGTPQANEFEDLYGKIISVDVNTTTGDIWFTTVQLNSGANGELGGIYRASIDAGGNATVTLVYQETNATNFNFQYIEIDEETGRYYVTSVEPNEANNHSLFSGLLTDVGVQPTFIASLGNINGLSPLGLSVQSAPTLTGTGLTPGVTEASSATNSGETARVALYSGLTAADIDPPTGDELAGAQVRISLDFQSGAGHQDFLRISGNTSGTIAGSGITYSYDSTNGVLTLSGAATVAEYAAALLLVTFSTSGDDPTAYGNAISRIVSASVFDGLLYSDELNATVTVTGINDAPFNTVGGAAAATEDGSAFAITGISMFDVDADPATQDIVVTLSVALGTITVQTNVVGGIIAGDITGGANGSGTITITATQNQINATLAAATGLTFTPPANYNGATTLTVTTNDLGLNGNDPGLTGTGTSEADSDNKVINIANVNDAPTVIDATQSAPTILEDTPSTGFESVNLLFGASFSDALDQQQTGGNPTGSVANAFHGVAIVANGSTPATGNWQYFNGSVWVNIGTASQSAAVFVHNGAAIRFNPALNYNGAAPTLTVHLVDDSGANINNGTLINLSGVGATGGTTRYSADTVVLAQDITAVNDAPVITNLNGDVATYTEQQSPTLLESGNAILTDVDSANFDTGTLTVSIGAGLVASQDELVILATSGIGVVGATVTYNGTQIGTFTGTGVGGGPLVFTFDADATLIAVQSLIRAIGYTNSGGDNPTGGARTINWSLVDGDGTANSGADTVTQASSVNVLAVNDRPQGTDATYTFNEDGSRTLSQADFGFSDPAEGHGFAGVAITTLPTNGVLLLNGVAITIAGSFVTAAQITANQLVFQSDSNENGTPYATFTFQVRDDGGVLNGGGDTDSSANTLTFNVTAVNDAPVNSVPGLQTINEDGSVTLSSGNGNAISVSDADATALTVTLSVAQGTLTLATPLGLSFSVGDGTADTTMTFAGSAAAINAALGSGLTYNPNSNFNGSDAISVTTTDNGQTGTGPTGTDSDAVTINITAINDAPVVIGDGTESAATINEDTPGAGQSIQSLFAGQYSDAADNQIPNGGASSPGQFSGIAVTANGSTAATGQWQYFSGGVWTNIGTVSTAAAKLFGDPSATLIRFNPALDYNGAAPTLTVHLIDNSLSFGITNGQVVDLSGAGATGNTTAYSTSTVVLSQDISAIADIADDNVSVNEDSVNNVFNLLANDTFENGSRAITAVGAALHGTAAINNNGTPGDATDDYVIYTPVGGYFGPDSFTYTVTSGGVTETATVTVNVEANNVAPVADLNGAAAGIDTTGSYTEGGLTIRPIQNIVLSDVDSANLTGATVTIATGFVTGDLLRMSGGFSGTTASGITFGYNSATGVLTLSGSATVADYQAALATLAFKTNNDNPGTARDITVVVNDGAASSVAAHINLSVTATNDAPVNSVPGGQVGAESSSIVFSATNGNALTISDADAGAGTMRVRLVVDHGTLTLGSIVGLTVTGNGTGLVKITGTLAAINAALDGLSLQGDAGYTGPATLTITTHDLGNSGVGVNLTDTDSVAITWESVSQEGIVQAKPSTGDPDASVAAAFAPATNDGYGDNGFDAMPYPFNLGTDTILGSTFLV